MDHQEHIELNAAERERFARQLSLPEIGEEGHKKLRNARILIVGAGGLGSPAAMYLAAAGVGYITVLDDQKLEPSNLPRQLLYESSGIGHLKAALAEQRLKVMSDRTQDIQCISELLTERNVSKYLKDCNLVVDCSDNEDTRRLISKACIQRGIPDVYGAVGEFLGQITVFERGGPCYRCLYPKSEQTSRFKAGPLGPLPGVVGSLQAGETLKLLLGIGEPLTGRLLVYDMLQATFETITLTRKKACPLCRGKQ